jgi:hypothetical protein
MAEAAEPGHEVLQKNAGFGLVWLEDETDSRHVSFVTRDADTECMVSAKAKPVVDAA